MTHARRRRGNAKLRQAVYAAATPELLGGREQGQTLAREQRQEGPNSVKRRLGLADLKKSALTRTEGANGPAGPQSPAPALGFRA